MQAADSEPPQPAPIRVVLAAMDPLEEERSRAVCDAALELADLHGADLRFVFAVPPVHLPSAGTEGLAQRELLNQASPRLDALVEQVRQRGITATWNARVAGVMDAIRSDVEEGSADLVIVSTPRRWLPGRWLRKLRRTAGVPILAIPEPEDAAEVRLDDARRILVPSFRRKGALRSVAAALRIFSPPAETSSGSRVLLLQPRGEASQRNRGRPDAPWVEEAVDATREERRMAGIADDLQELGVETDAILPQESDPVEAVAQQADEAAVDVVAVDAGARSRSRIFAWLRRSFVGRLLRRVSRPLLVP